MISHAPTYDLMLRALIHNGRLLPAPAPVEEPKLLPAHVKPAAERFVMILSGTWRRVRVVNADLRTGTQWVCVDIVYGVRWFTQAQLDLWAREYSKLGRKAVAA